MYKNKLTVRLRALEPNISLKWGKGGPQMGQWTLRWAPMSILSVAQRPHRSGSEAHDESYIFLLANLTIIIFDPDR